MGCGARSAPHKEERVSARLIDGLATTGALANLFSDESVLQAALAFEVAFLEVFGA